MYRTDGWFQSESISGPGSTLQATEHLRSVLREFRRVLFRSSLLDAGCGDFNWMKEVDLGEVEYIGVDVVASEIIERNNQLYGAVNRHFMVKDITRDNLPKVDLILCRDCLTHLPNKKVLRALQQFRCSGSTYLMTTSHPLLMENADTFTGGFRPLNLERPPFDWPAPLMQFGSCVDETSGTGVLGLWKLNEI